MSLVQRVALGRVSCRGTRTWSQQALFWRVDYRSAAVGLDRNANRSMYCISTMGSMEALPTVVIQFSNHATLKT